jgi:hypothetical protein
MESYTKFSISVIGTRFLILYFTRLSTYRNADTVFVTSGFLQLSQHCLQSLLQCPEKNIDEVSAFKAMLRHEYIHMHLDYVLSYRARVNYIGVLRNNMNDFTADGQNVNVSGII